MVVGISARTITLGGGSLRQSLQPWNMWQTSKLHRDHTTLSMGVRWYRPEPWKRLREMAEDKEHVALAYEDARVASAQKMHALAAQGMRPIKVEVDVEALLSWCPEQGLPGTPETRTKCMLNTVRDLGRQGIITP